MLIKYNMISSFDVYRENNINSNLSSARSMEVVNIMEKSLSYQNDRNNRTLLNSQNSEITKQKNFMICELC